MVRSEPYRLHLFLIIIGIIVGVSIFSYSASKQRDFHPEDFGLGLNTQTRIGMDRDKLISVTGNGDQLKLFIPQIITRFKELKSEGKKVALWLGASQLHAINRKAEDDRLAVEFANQLSIDHSDSIAYLQVSTPNANFHDLLILYQLFRQEELKPDWLIVALVYDDLRENPIQKFLLELLKPLPKEVLSNYSVAMHEIQKEINANLNSDAKHQVVERTVTHGTLQEKIEHYLISLLNQYLPGYQYRDKLQSKISILVTTLVSLAAIEVSLIKYRKHSDDSQRYPDIAPHLIDWNKNALKEIIEISKSDSTNLLLYRQPIRPTTGAFYHNRQLYQEFFDQLSNQVDNKSTYYLDLESIVESQDWGITNLGEPDVFHFTVRGHYLLGNAIYKFISEHKENVIQ